MVNSTLPLRRGSPINIAGEIHNDCEKSEEEERPEEECVILKVECEVEIAIENDEERKDGARTTALSENLDAVCADKY